MEVDPYYDSVPLTFTSDFDSGNSLNVELVTGKELAFTEPYFNHQQTDYEVNVSTKPDCHGSRYENGNRTWFFFGVTGGKPGGMIKINVLNLNKQSKLFEQGMQPVFCILPEKPVWERIRDRVVLIGKEENMCSISFRHKLPEGMPGASTLYLAFTYPYPYSEMTEWLDTLDSSYASGRFLTPSPACSKGELILTRSLSQSIQNEIYYHRECVCLSLEGRRLELLTISSVFGQSKEREPFLENLFPFRDSEARPFKYPTKKVVFLSARVHPGETCSQFVLNGFLKFILEPRDPRALILRRLFVFKLIPILNPDGVARGHYRTDPRGVNLNRVYLKPSPTLHPTIYAARKLLLYAHHGHDTPDDYEYEEESPIDNIESGPVSLAENSSAEDSVNDAGTQSLCAGCVAVPISKQVHSVTDDGSMITDENERTSSQIADSHQCTFDSCDEDSLDLKLRDSTSFTTRIVNLASFDRPGPSSGSGSKVTPPKRSKSKLKKGSRSQDRFVVDKEDSSSEKLDGKSKRSKVKRRTEKSLHARSSTKLRTSVSYQTASKGESDSGLFLYIDMHGHATKRGIFMYGNHFSNANVQAECLLLPRLMAMNSQHFDFSGCNFTERLMALKDRRDGASREGSGRVAVLKLTGLVRSYTLECNYNTGRLVNHLPSRPLSFGFNDPLQIPTSHPPKFTPTIFESIGKAIGESVLDLTGHNPWSRINFTDFRSLDGMRKFLLRRLLNSQDYRPKDKEPPVAPLRRAASYAGPAANPSSSSAMMFRGGSTNFIGSPSRKRSITKMPVQSKLGPLVPKKENQSEVLNLSKPSSSKLKAARSSNTFEKQTSLTFAAPTASSKAKQLRPAKVPVPASVLKKLPPEPLDSGQSKSLITKIFRSKKKVQNMKSSEKKLGSV